MSLFSWFTRKSPARSPAGGRPAGPADANAARQHAGTAHAPRADGPRLEPAAVLKVERTERREWVYSVVREAMLHAGVLSSTYKFKVLALDERGRRFLIMVDLAREIGGDTVDLLKVEDHITHTAKARYDLEITAVYWRTNDLIAVGRAKAVAAAAGLTPVHSADSGNMPLHPVHSPSHAPARTSGSMPLQPGPVAKPSGKFEPIQADEVAAFKQALSSGTHTPVPVPTGEVVRSGPRRKVARGYEDTQMIEPNDRPDALSNTQYGDLR